MTSESKSCGERRLASHIMPISVSVFAALLLSILPLHAQELSDLPRTRQVQIAAETAGENLKNRAKEEKLKAEEEKKRKAVEKVLALIKEPVGIVTALRGKAQLTREVARTPLRFRDDLILRDVVDTEERSLTRIMFGSASVLTVRELSRLEVREELLPSGATRSIHDLSLGGVFINVGQKLLRPGDEVQIRTPNAIATVRGTIIFTQFIPLLAQSIFTLLAGTVVVTPVGLPPVTLTPFTAVTISGDATTGIQVSPVEPVTQAQVDKIVRESNAGPVLEEEVVILQAARRSDTPEESAYDPTADPGMGKTPPVTGTAGVQAGAQIPAGGTGAGEGLGGGEVVDQGSYQEGSPEPSTVVEPQEPYFQDYPPYGPRYGRGSRFRPPKWTELARPPRKPRKRHKSDKTHKDQSSREERPQQGVNCGRTVSCDQCPRGVKGHISCETGECHCGDT